MKSLLLDITENFLAPQFLQIGQERKGFDHVFSYQQILFNYHLISG